MEMMERAGNSHLLTVLSYPNTGHLIEPPYIPHARASAFRSVSTREKSRFNFRSVSCDRNSPKLRLLTFQFPVVFPVMALWGGETVAHSRAQEDAWRKTLVFLRENLYGGTNPGAALFSHL